MKRWVFMTHQVALLSAVLHAAGPPQPPVPPLRPTFVYDRSRGCWDIEVYSTNVAETEVLSVNIALDRNRLPTKARPLVIDLARPPKDTEVVVEVYRTRKHHWPCTHSLPWGAEEPTTWVATRGSLSVVAEPPASNQPEYAVTVRVTNAEFVGPGGMKVRPNRALELRTLAGRPDGG